MIYPEHKTEKFAIDIDRTLCEYDCYTPDQAREVRSKEGAIDLINRLFRYCEMIGGSVEIYTARKRPLLPATMEWLNMHGVLFHSFSNYKRPSDIIVDSDSMTLEQIEAFLDRQSLMSD